MTDKQAAIEVINSLPQDATLESMIEELQILVAVHRGRAAISAGRVKTQEQVKQLVESWSTHIPTRS